MVYYIGDRDIPLRKIQKKWSGPWRVLKHLYPNKVEIQHTKNGTKEEAHVSRIKKYHKKHFWEVKQYEKLVKQGKIKDKLAQINNDQDGIDTE